MYTPKNVSLVLLPVLLPLGCFSNVPLALFFLLCTVLFFIVRKLFPEQHFPEGIKALNGFALTYFNASECLRGASKVIFVTKLKEVKKNTNKKTILFSQPDILVQKLRIALDKLQQRHAMLQVKVENFPPTSAQKCFVRSDFQIPLSVVDGDQNSWIDFAKKDVNQEFAMDESARRHLLYVNVFLHQEQAKEKHAEIVMTAHQSICDGVSMVQLSNDLLRLIVQEAEQKREESENFFVPDMHDALIAMYPTWAQRFTIFIKGLISHEFNRRTASVIHPVHAKRVVSEKQIVTDTTVLNEMDAIEGEQLNRLIDNCRLNNATVHSAVCSAVAMACYEEIKAMNEKAGTVTQKKLNIFNRVTVNMRNKMIPAVSEKDLEMFVSSMVVENEIPANLEQSAKEDTLWKVAKHTKAEIHKVVNGNQGKLIENLFYREHSQPYISRQIAANCYDMNCTFSTSNLGDQTSNIRSIYSGKDVDELEVTGMKFWGGVQHEKTIGVHILTLHERMSITLSFPFPPVEDASLPARIAAASKHYLEEMCK